MHQRIRLAAAVACALAGSGLAGAAGGADTATRYTVTGLGTLGGDRSEAAALNERGEVVGWSRTADGLTRAFVYRRGRMTDLGTLPGFRESYAYGINDRGDIAGAGVGEQELRTADTGVSLGKIPVRRAVLWRDGKAEELGPGEARDVNNRRQVVGNGWLWDAEKGRAKLSDGLLRAEAINEAGQVAGFIAGSDGGFRNGIGEPFLWTAGKLEVILPGRGSPTAKPVAYDLNDRGAVVGVASHLDGEAFLWQDGKPAYLGTLNGEIRPGFLGMHAGLQFSAAYGVNNRGQVVGAANVDDAGTLHAFLWEKGRLTDLNTRVDGGGWVLERAEAINDRGQICGTARRDGQTRAVLLTPAL